MKYLQTTVSDCMLSFFDDLEAFIDMKLDTEPNKQMAVQWTGDKFIQRLFYNIFKKLNLDYSLDFVRNIVFIKPKFHKVRDFEKKIISFADVQPVIETEDLATATEQFVCKNCGIRVENFDKVILEEDNDFCPECGAKVKDGDK